VAGGTGVAVPQVPCADAGAANYSDCVYTALPPNGPNVVTHADTASDPASSSIVALPVRPAVQRIFIFVMPRH
jgi:hypothetical protein